MLKYVHICQQAKVLAEKPPDSGKSPKSNSIVLQWCFMFVLYAIRSTLSAIFFHAIRNTSDECQPTKEYVRNYQQIMQNEPNFPEVRMSVTSVSAKDYENKSDPTLGQNKPKTNPIKANFQTTPRHVSNPRIPAIAKRWPMQNHLFYLSPVARAKNSHKKSP